MALSVVSPHDLESSLGSDAPVGIAIDFQDISYSVKGKGKGKLSDIKILKSCSGNIQAGKLTACMGPSGAGKTSLLNILSARVGSTDGQMFLNKKKLMDRKQILTISSYVQQDDCMLATQTVQETIEFAAALTLGKETTPEEKLKRANEVIALFGLEKCRNTYIGDTATKLIGVSGGERKRTAIACSCVAMPSILYLDEPTSGLDSFTAISVVRILKRLTDRGVTVVTTIHQPNGDIFRLFDSLLLILNGEIIYHRPVLESVEYFAELGFKCPMNDNPADYYFMHVMTEGDEEIKNEINFNQDDRNKLLAEKWAEQSSFSKEGLLDEEFQGLENSETEMAPLTTQFKLLYSRSWKEAIRNPMRVRAQFGQAVFFSLIVATIWWQVGNDQTGIQDRNGVLFFIAMNGLMSSLMGVLSTFGNERGTFVRDFENGLYCVGPYFLGKVACDGPFYIVFPTILVSLMYWTVGFQANMQKFGTCILTVILLNFAGSSMGIAIASVFEDIAVALLVAPLVVLPLVMFSGFFLNSDSIPVYYLWAEWISPMKYAFAALAKNEFEGLDLMCESDQFVTIETVSGEELQKCPFTSGDDFVETFNIQDWLSIRLCLTLLFVMTVVFYFIAFLLLKKLVLKKSM